MRLSLLTLILALVTPHVLGASLAFNAHHELRLPDTNHDRQQASFQSTPLSSPPTLTLKSRPTNVYRPRSLDLLHHARLQSLHHSESPSEPLQWDPHHIEGPDVQDRHTLTQLARMSGNAYALPGQKNWYEVDTAWNTSFPFGWEESDGFRGHVFLSSDNSTVVLSIKGTTLNGPTSKKDKFNDNLLFSCCCAFVDFSWVFRTVCSCYTSHWRCDSTCLSTALIQDSLFYSIGVTLVNDLRNIYPHANIWLVGHSLGGALASLLGATYGLPAVAFESPGERVAAGRLHLPIPPLVVSNVSSEDGRQRYISPIATTHVYHTADPIPQGTCTGFGSPCAQAGYALETRCHLGKSIVFDTVSKLGWKVDVRKHVIRSVITEVLEAEGIDWVGEDDDGEEGKNEVWGGKKKKGGKGGEGGEGRVPEAKEEVDCVDCFKWEFGDFKEPPEDPGDEDD
ncbi:alpha/beta-hydrolase [Crucibulum laeve]|uniref:triacylglycerol lipase n=1 Tax=Crucibulum laeve TaxID=68775 RepID=A0A5C3M9Z3_9AGAR|nr:alpha/beta-hydrolase [Crucibulum laeve]